VYGTLNRRAAMATAVATTKSSTKLSVPIEFLKFVRLTREQQMVINQTFHEGGVLA
jgi:chorismate mutase